MNKLSYIQIIFFFQYIDTSRTRIKLLIDISQPHVYALIVWIAVVMPLLC